MSEAICPRCDQALQNTNYDSYGFIELDICQSCKGIWFDEGELDHLDDSINTNAEVMEFKPADPTSHHPLNCPRCSKTLIALTVPGEEELIIDRCESCRGFWLDEGELEKVREALLKSDSETHEDGKNLTKPPGWSLVRWAIYRFKECSLQDIEELGKAAGPTHRI